MCTLTTPSPGSQQIRPHYIDTMKWLLPINHYSKSGKITECITIRQNSERFSCRNWINSYLRDRLVLFQSLVGLPGSPARIFGYNTVAWKPIPASNVLFQPGLGTTHLRSPSRRSFMTSTAVKRKCVEKATYRSTCNE